MKKVKVNKEELLSTVRKNRAEHESIFAEALSGYHKELLKTIDQLRADVVAGKSVSHSLDLVKPVNHLKLYDRVIKMLEMSIEKEIELDDMEFANYVMDDWTWKDSFIMSNSSYSQKAATLRR